MVAEDAVEDLGGSINLQGEHSAADRLHMIPALIQHQERQGIVHAFPDPDMEGALRVHRDQMGPGIIPPAETIMGLPQQDLSFRGQGIKERHHLTVLSTKRIQAPPAPRLLYDNRGVCQAGKPGTRNVSGAEEKIKQV